MDQMQQVLKQLSREQHHLDEALQGTAEDIDQDLLQMGEGNWKGAQEEVPPQER